MELEAHMDVLLAEETLAGRHGPVPDSKVYDLVLAVTGSEEKASAAQAAWYAEKMKRGETPEV